MGSSVLRCCAFSVLLNCGLASRFEMANIIEMDNNIEEGGEQDESNRSTLLHYLASDYIHIDPVEAQESLLKESSNILFDYEKIEMAFKCGKYRLYFTTLRMIYNPNNLLRSVGSYHSIPYDSIMGYSFETAGWGLDFDNHLNLYLNTVQLSTFRVGFRKGHKAGRVDIYSVSAYIAQKLLGLNVEPLPEATKKEDNHKNKKTGSKKSMMEKNSVSLEIEEEWLGDIWAWFAGNAAEIDSKEVEQGLRESVQLLGKTEKVLLAFKVGRDTMIMTSRRMILIDVKGLTGKQINYMVIPYEAIKAFEVETAGTLDPSAQMRMWTEIPAYPELSYDFQASKSDPSAVNRLLSDMILGSKNYQGKSFADTGSRSGFDVLKWLTDSATQVDPKQVESQLREQGMLQASSDEEVLMAFRVIRDFTVLTNKRLMLVDVKGLTGKRVCYRSVPYHGIHAYEVEVDGLLMTRATIKIWTAVNPPPPMPRKGGVVLPPPPCPTIPDWHTCMSYFEFHLDERRVDVMGVQRLLSEYVLPRGGSKTPAKVDFNKVGDSMKNLLSFFTDNARQVDKSKAQGHLSPLLQSNEEVRLAFKLALEWHVWTNKRFLLVDQDLDGIAYRSIPYDSIKAFDVTTAGLLDNDAELAFYTAMPWKPWYSQDLKKGGFDFKEIMQVLGKELVNVQLQRALVDTGGPGVIRWFRGAASEKDLAEANKKFHSDPAILMKEEDVKFAGQSGRDTVILTSDRALEVDVQGISGKRIRYRSIFYRSVGSFSVREAGKTDVDTDVELYTQAWSLPKFRQRLAKTIDIFNISDLVSAGVMQAHGA